MRNFNEKSITEAALERIQGTPDPRLKQIVTGLIRHLHDFAREVELTEAEWFAGIEFLTATGHMCDDKRQEFILLSDTLGLSMLVDAVANRKPEDATQSTVFGPFYRPGAPQLPLGASIAPDGKGEPTFVLGRVLDHEGRPLAGAELDVWQTDHEGLYDVQRPELAGMEMRGRFQTDAQGRFHFRTVKPVSYSIPDDGTVGAMLKATGRHPFRPAHIHMIVSAPGHQPVTTHLFVDGDPYLDSDAVFGVKSSLVVPFKQHGPGSAPDGTRMPVPFLTCDYDFRLVPVRPAA